MKEEKYSLQKFFNSESFARQSIVLLVVWMGLRLGKVDVVYSVYKICSSIESQILIFLSNKCPVQY